MSEIDIGGVLNRVSEIDIIDVLERERLTALKLASEITPYQHMGRTYLRVNGELRETPPIPPAGKKEIQVASLADFVAAVQNCSDEKSFIAVGPTHAVCHSPGARKDYDFPYTIRWPFFPERLMPPRTASVADFVLWMDCYAVDVRGGGIRLNENLAVDFIESMKHDDLRSAFVRVAINTGAKTEVTENGAMISITSENSAKGSLANTIPRFIAVQLRIDSGITAWAIYRIQITAGEKALSIRIDPIARQSVYERARAAVTEALREKLASEVPIYEAD